MAAYTALPRRERDEPARVALVGRPWDVDAVAAALLADGGDRRALVPLPRPEPSLLHGMTAVVLAAARLEEARRATRAHRPLVAALPPRGDRHAFAALPRLGHDGLVDPLPDGAVDVAGVLAALARRLPADELAALAGRLPALAPFADRALARRAAARAAIAALGAGPLAAAAAVAGPAGGLDALRGTGDADGPAAGTTALVTAGAALVAGAIPARRPLRAALVYAAVAAAARRRPPSAAAPPPAPARHVAG